MQKHKWSRLAEAFDFAAREHQHQLRKDTDIPYISHLMSVSALVMENGGDEDQAIAGLLHDVIEDADPPTRIPEIKHEILDRFGERVLKIVEACSDCEPDQDGRKPSWKKRKEAYIDSLEIKSLDILLVACCDKLHNAGSILTDYITHGDKVYERFTASKTETLWYYKSLSAVFLRRLTGLRSIVAARELASVVEKLDE